MAEQNDQAAHVNASSTERSERWFERASLALLVLLSLAFLYRSSYSASALEVVPDSVEYALGAKRLVTLGQFNITLNGAAYPPRYSPWFSAVALAPVYELMRGDDGAGIFAVLVFGIVGIVAAYEIGRRLGGVWSGAGAALCLMTFKEYHVMARLILTDLPCAVLGLLACLVYLRSTAGFGIRQALTAGLICGLCFSFRSDMVALCLPFVVLACTGKRLGTVGADRPGRVAGAIGTEELGRPSAVVGRPRWTERGVRLVCVLAPLLVVEVATLLYNQNAFGDWRRNGYHFWCADPYDYPWLVWSAAYVKRNLINLFAKQAILVLLMGAIGTAILWRRGNREARSVLWFLALAAGPPSVAHLFYFSPGIRFFLLGLSIAAVLGGAGLALLIPVAVRRRTALLLGLLAVSLLAAPAINRRLAITPTRRIAADRIARLTPTDAVIVSGIDPVYLDWRLVRGTRRTVVPYSRGVGYANLVIVRRRISHPNPAPVLYQPRSIQMYRGGGFDAVPFTADEAPERLLAWARAGRPVYLDLTETGRNAPDATLLRRVHWFPVPGAPRLFRLVPMP
jgi:hypothetical protein